MRWGEERRPGDAVLSPEAALALRALQSELRAAIDSGWAERDRLAICCRYLLELSEAETATALGWPRGTVKFQGGAQVRRPRSG